MNLGDVIVEEDNLYGDGVNVASRLEALAEPGLHNISLVNSTTRYEIGHEFCFYWGAGNEKYSESNSYF